MRKTVCIDLDATLAYYDRWRGVDHFGDPIPGAVEFVNRIAEDFDVVIYTTRCNPEMNRPEAAHLLVNRVRHWLDEHGFTYHDIYSGVGKPICFAIIDDRAIACRPLDVDIPQDAYEAALLQLESLKRG